MRAKVKESNQHKSASRLGKSTVKLNSYSNNNSRSGWSLNPPSTPTDPIYLQHSQFPLHTPCSSAKMFSGHGSRFGSGSNQVPTSRRFPFETSFSQPILSFSAQRNPSEEHLIVVDLSRGFIRTTRAEARDLAETGYVNTF